MEFQMEIKDLYKIFLKYPSIIIDSRLAKKDSIFFALKGENFDGNTYADNAINDGCSYAVIDDITYKKDERFILVNNVLNTLQELAKYHRDNLNIPIIGITGTNGKTTTKELLNCILLKKYNSIATIGNLNNHIGVPLTILSINKKHEIAIVEMGANHQLEIQQLCRISKPNFGIITNIGKAHLEGFGGFEGVIKTKSELYDFIYENNASIFVNSDNSLLLDKSIKIDKRILYGTTSDFCKGKVINSNPFLSVEIEIGNSSVIINSNLIGNYNFENILAACSIGHYFRVNINDIKLAIEEYQPQNNRSQVLKTDNNLLILDAYNANPTSMMSAITNFISLKNDNKILILGDMRELGGESEQEHKLIIDFLKKNNIENVYLVGSEFSMYNDCLHYKTFDNSDLALKYFKNNKIINSTVLIKGSRGIKLEKITEAL